jgi:excisionase family DNA binding protein
MSLLKLTDGALRGFRYQTRAINGVQAMLTIHQTAAVLGVNPMTVRRWIRKRWLPAIRLGPQTVRIRIADVRALRRAMQEYHNGKPFPQSVDDRLGTMARFLSSVPRLKSPRLRSPSPLDYL